MVVLAIAYDIKVPAPRPETSPLAARETGNTQAAPCQGASGGKSAVAALTSGGFSTRSRERRSGEPQGGEARSGNRTARVGETERDMSDEEQRVREIAYDLWDHAGRPEAGGDEFWFAAKRKLAEPADRREIGLVPKAAADEPPIVAAAQGMPATAPEGRVADPAGIDGRAADELPKARRSARKAR